MAGNAALKASAPVFAALGDETRLRLVSRLCSGGPASIARLTAGSSVTRQAITKHLHVLAGAGLVRGTRRGASASGSCARGSSCRPASRWTPSPGSRTRPSAG
jgi:predicted transcriptional regulator